MVVVNYCGDFWWFRPTFWLFVPFYSEAEWEPKALVLWALKACGSSWGLTRLDSKHGDWVPGFLWYSIFGVEPSIANYFEVICICTNSFYIWAIHEGAPMLEPNTCGSCPFLDSKYQSRVEEKDLSLLGPGLSGYILYIHM